MKYLHLVWASLFRRKLRTILTLVSIAAAFLLFGLLDAVRVYGEMVNLLWRQNLPAAQRLEVLWNEVIQAHSISLFCAYHVDGEQGESLRFPSDLRAAHSHLIPVEACA